MYTGLTVHGMAWELTVCRTSLPVLLGLPGDLLGADRSTSGVNLAARMVIMKSCVLPATAWACRGW